MRPSNAAECNVEAAESKDEGRRFRGATRLRQERARRSFVEENDFAGTSRDTGRHLSPSCSTHARSGNANDDQPH
jgi:hypothetical protein